MVVRIQSSCDVLWAVALSAGVMIALATSIVAARGRHAAASARCAHSCQRAASGASRGELT